MFENIEKSYKVEVTFGFSYSTTIVHLFSGSLAIHSDFMIIQGTKFDKMFEDPDFN